MTKNIVIITLSFIILLGLLLRIFYLHNQLHFWTDSARDLLITEKIWNSILNLDFSSLPIRGSDADTFLEKQVYGGAFYYYLIVIPGLITQFHPFGMAAFTLILNIVAIYLMFIYSKKLLGDVAGIISSMLLSTSSVVVAFSTFLWNPNLYVFFHLLTLVLFLKILDGDKRYWLAFTLTASVTTQVHIVGYIFIIFTFLPVIILKRIYPPGRILFFSLLLFLLPQFPIILSEFTSKFSNIQATIFYLQHLSFEFNGKSNSLFAITYIAENFLKISTNYLFGVNPYLLISFCLFSIFLAFFRETSPKRHHRLVLSAKKFLILGWLLSSFLILLLSSPHFNRDAKQMLLPIFPTVIFIFTVILNRALSRSWSIPIAMILLFIILYFNILNLLQNKSIWQTPTLQDHEQLALFLQEKSNKQEYNLKIPEIILQESIYWVLDNQKVHLPQTVNNKAEWITPLSKFQKKLNGKPAKITYVAVYIYTPEVNCFIERKFGQIKLYACKK